jgi:type VI secretion system secreted protein VgrG
MPRQSNLRYTFATAAGLSFDVVEFTLHEALSEPFRLAVELAHNDEAIAFDQVIDREATLTIWHGDAVARHVHGIVTGFALGASGTRRTRYSAAVEPALIRAALCSDWRIFQQQAVPAILGELLKAQGVLHRRVALQSPAPPREYCVQAGETDLVFHNRLAAEEGLVYAFVHTDQAHTLIHTDSVQRLGEVEGEPVVFVAAAGGDADGPSLWSLSYAEHLRTTQQVQRDYSFRQPRYDQQHTRDINSTDTPRGQQTYTHYDYPGRYKGDAAGKPMTATRLAALRHDARVAQVEGDDARLLPGQAFTLEGHPREDLNTSWRVVRMTHRGSQATSLEEDNPGGGTHYAFQAELVPAAMDWKAPLWTKPRIDGPHVATVVGPPGEEAVADTWGRVKVRFPWDRSDTADDHRSCWIRVAQGWAGASYGAMLTPRAGHEVLVDFLDGDPDQPIITGRMHHVAQLPPYELPRFQALTVVKTKELDGQRANELRLDDTHGQISAALMSDHDASALHLGYLTHPRPDGGEPRGEGFELRTDGSGTLRAAKGLLLTTDGQACAVGGQLSHDELVEGLERALALVRQLGERASENGGVTHDSAPQSELTDAVRGLGGGANDQAGASAATGASVMALSSPAGIAAGSPQSIILAAGQQLAAVAGTDLQLTAGQHLTLDAGKDLGLSAHTGDLRQIAHEGDMLLQAQRKNIRVQAAKNVDVAAEANLTLSAVKQLLALCDGAYLTMSGGNMEIGLPGTLKLRAGQLLVEGPSSIPTPSWSAASSMMAGAMLGGLAVAPVQLTCSVWDDDGPVAAEPQTDGEVETGASIETAPAMAPATALSHAGHAAPRGVPGTNLPIAPPDLARFSSIPKIPSLTIVPPAVCAWYIPDVAERPIKTPVDMGTLAYHGMFQPQLPNPATTLAYEASTAVRTATSLMGMGTPANYGMFQPLWQGPAHQVMPPPELIDKHGTLTGGTNKKVRFDIAFEAATAVLTATVVIEVSFKDLHYLDPSTKQPLIDLNGTNTTSFRYDSTANGRGIPPSQRDPNFVEVDRAANVAWLQQQKINIEATLNQNGYHLVLARCSQRTACGCRVAVSLKVQFVISGQKAASKPHAKVTIYANSSRADAMSWGEQSWAYNGKTNLYVPNPDLQVHAHEVGHLFGWPDEYWQDGGHIHKQYVDENLNIDFSRGALVAANNEMTWRLDSPDSLMGHGATKPAALTPEYYFYGIRDWFAARTQKSWTVTI